MSVFIMIIIAIIAFLTVVAVMVVGSKEDDFTPHSVSDSTAVASWQARADAKEQALVAATEAAAESE